PGRRGDPHPHHGRWRLGRPAGPPVRGGGPGRRLGQGERHRCPRGLRGGDGRRPGRRGGLRRAARRDAGTAHRRRAVLRPGSGVRPALRRASLRGGPSGVRRSARDLIALTIDSGTWESWDEPVTDPAPLDPAYADALAAARRRTGLDEAVITGAGRLGGRRVAVVASEFGFLGGSIGVAAAERLTRAIERATAERLPLLA